LANRRPLLARRTHKWLAVIVGLQALIWAISGLYMTAIHIDIIHGEHFVRNAEPRPIPAPIMDPVVAAGTVPAAQSVKFNWLLDRPTYIIASEGRRSLVDAITGAPVPPPTEAQIKLLANYWFKGAEKLSDVKLITEVPGEIRGRKPPLWRVDFDGWNNPTLYFSPETGELVTRRHELWRLFDFFWMTHIMDYETRDNVNNRLLIIASWITLAMTLAGGWLLLYSFPKKKRRRRPT
jgi:uncharacterized iron-regulated membrane protein